MSQIRNIIVAIIALIIIYFFVQMVNIMRLPNFFLLIAGFMIVLILWNVARSVIRGY